MLAQVQVFLSIYKKKKSFDECFTFSSYRSTPDPVRH